MELHGSSEEQGWEGVRRPLQTATIAAGALIAWCCMAAQARADGHLFHRHCDVVLLVPVETTVAPPARRTIIVRTVSDDQAEPEADDTDDSSREIVVPQAVTLSGREIRAAEESRSREAASTAPEDHRRRRRPPHTPGQWRRLSHRDPIDWRLVG